MTTPPPSPVLSAAPAPDDLPADMPVADNQRYTVGAARYRAYRHYDDDCLHYTRRWSRCDAMGDFVDDKIAFITTVEREPFFCNKEDFEVCVSLSLSPFVFFCVCTHVRACVCVCS